MDAGCESTEPESKSNFEEKVPWSVGAAQVRALGDLRAAEAAEKQLLNDPRFGSDPGSDEQHEHLTLASEDLRSDLETANERLAKKEKPRQNNRSSGCMVNMGGGMYDSASKSQGVSTLRRNKWINRQVTRIADTGDLQKLLQTVQYYIAEMNGINLVTALHRVTKLAAANAETTAQLLRQPSFQLLRATVVQHIDMHKAKVDMADGASCNQPFLEVQCMSIVCWSCATLRLRDERLLDKITEIALPCLHEFKPFELANMLWAYAKLSLGKRSLFSAVSDKVLKRQDGEFSLQCLSMIAWSFATEKQRDPAMFASIAIEITFNASLSKPQEIANTLWAYAKNHCAELQLFNTLADIAVSSGMLWFFKPQELSNTVWAFATINFQHAPLFKHAVAVAINKRHELAPQNIANILWAYARFQTCSRSGLFPALLQVSVAHLPQHKPYEISAIVWAAAKDNDPSCGRFFKEIAHMCGSRLHEFPPQALANMVEAFAVVDANTPGFQDAMDRESVSRLHQFSPIALSNLFRGVVINTARAADENRCSELNWPTLSAVGTHIAMRATELQRSELEHVELSLQRLNSNVCESVVTWLRQTIAKEMEYRYDRQTKSEADSFDDLGYPGLSCFDALGLDTVDGEGESELFGPGGTDFESESHGSKGKTGKGGGKQRNKGFEERRGGGGAARRNQVARPAMHSNDQTYARNEAWSIPGTGGEKGVGKHDWQQSYGKGYSNNWDVPNVFGEASWSGAPSGSNIIWSDSRVPERSPAYVANESVSLDPPWPSMALAKRNTPSHAMPPASSEFYGRRAGFPPPRQSSDMWEPCAIDVSCLVQPVQDSVGSESWRVVDLNEYIYASLVGTGSSVLRLRFGIVDERVVVKRIVDTSVSWPAALANEPHMLPPRATVATSDGRNHYAVYTYCEHGSLAEWITDKTRSGQTLTNADIGSVVLGIAKSAAQLVACGVDVSAICIDDIFIDIMLAPRVRLRQDQSTRSLPLTSAAKWFSPEEAEVFSPEFPCYSTWPAVVYRIGLLMYCMCAGVADPYPSKHVDLVIMDLRREKLGPSFPIRPDMSRIENKDFHTMILRCLASDPDERPDQNELYAFLSSQALWNA